MLASRHSESISLLVAKPIRLVIYILKPIIWILTTFINFLIALLGGKDWVKHPFVTEEIIKMMLRVGKKEGTIDKHEREIIHKVFEFSDKKGYSRIPVYKTNPNSIVGMIYAKDFLKFRDHELGQIKVHQILRPVLIVKAGRKISPILKELQQKKINISVVVGDNKIVIGLLSIEDILEELVGEIFDEYDSSPEYS